MRVSNSYSGDTSLNVPPEMRVLSRTLTQYDCLHCHAAYGDYTTAQDWIDARTAAGAQLIIPGDGTDSPLIRRLRGVDPIMPPTGSVVDDASIDEIEAWINSL